MQTLDIPAGSTDVKLTVFVESESGAPLTGLVYNSSGLTCYTARAGAVAGQLNLATQTVTGAHSDGGFVEIDATNMPGWYRLDLADDLVAAGVKFAGICLKGASNMQPCEIGVRVHEAVAVDLTGALGASPWNATTIADALKSAWARGAGKMVLDVGTKVLTFYAPDGVTAVVTFGLDDATAPTILIPS